MKNILVPTDFSDCAKLAEAIGLEIAKKTKSEIHFLHILSTPIDWVNLPLKNEKLYPDIKAQINHAKNHLDILVSRAEKAGLKAKQFLIFNKGREEIVKHVSHHRHDFIVMGSRGASGINEIFGTNTQRVVRHSNAPVLVVKGTSKKFQISNIVFASTFNEDVRIQFERVVDFATQMKAKIHLLYVNVPFSFEETDKSLEKMNAFCATHLSKSSFTINIYNSLNEERGILKFSEAVGADLIALATHGRSGLFNLIGKSITEGLTKHSDVPILSLNIGHQ